MTYPLREITHGDDSPHRHAMAWLGWEETFLLFLETEQLFPHPTADKTTNPFSSNTYGYLRAGTGVASLSGCGCKNGFRAVKTPAGNAHRVRLQWAL